MNEWWCYLFGRGSHFPLLEAAITLAFTIVLSPPNGMTSHTTTTATAHGTHDDEQEKCDGESFVYRNVMGFAESDDVTCFVLLNIPFRGVRTVREASIRFMGWAV